MKRRLLSHGLLLLLGLVAAALATPAWAVDTPASAEWSLSADGAYVVDVRSKLAWPRCVQGMAWNGASCTGVPLLMTHGEATALAAARAKAEGVAWRLPRVPELRRLAGKVGKPASPDMALFPAAPQDWHWSITASINPAARINPYDYENIRQGRTGGNTDHIGVQQGWAVHLGTGEARGDVTKRSMLTVRLVRPNF
ncbi:MAG: DUF1566 domain-containing protein [Hylemonella sp.]|nr:DUF1566 domain-containing protein [Hylemonella sp.]